MANQRRQTPQTISWFWDLHKRDILDLDPEYQRRSVWNQQYKDFFIETILLNYPAPAIFIFEEIDEDGNALYSVVDGKQRLTTIFDFLKNDFAVADESILERLRGKYFRDLTLEQKRDFYSYEFSIEFLPVADEATLSSIFNRINRNVAKLTPQELRHARFSGVFASATDDLTELLFKSLPSGFPRITESSRRQMKDNEFVAQLLLLIENGIQKLTQADLDTAYSEKDEDWPARASVDAEFRTLVATLSVWGEGLMTGDARRYANQADFYSLFATMLILSREGRLPPSGEAVPKLVTFMMVVLDDGARSQNTDAKTYYEATRSASSDLLQRTERVTILSRLLDGA